MRRAAILALALALVPGCKKQQAAPPAGSEPAATAPPALSFVQGDVIAAVERDGVSRLMRLDPASARWQPLGGGDAGLFPTGQRLRGGLLCIATWGADEPSHQEQLAIVRGAAVERVGPVAAMVRNPTTAGATLIAETNEASYRDLYAIAADGTTRRLTNNPEGNFEPALSPDGTLVAYASSRDGNAELYVQSLADPPVGRRLTDAKGDDWGATWAPDGTTIAFLSDRESAQRLYTLPAGGGPARRVTAEPAGTAIEDQPRWSPDGATLAFVRGDGPALAVVLVDVASGKTRTLTPPGQVDLDFAWSPDGTHLAVIRRADSTPGPRGAIVLVRVADGVAIATGEIVASSVRWIAL